MAVYNEIEFDGRVQRAARALSPFFEITVLSIASGRGTTNLGLDVRAVTLPGGPLWLRHARFWWALWRLATRLRPEVVYAHDYFLSLAGWIGARVAGARFVYDAHELIVPEPGRKRPLRERVFGEMEGLVVHRADLVVAAGEERSDIMRRHYGLRSRPLVVRNIAPDEGPALDDAEFASRYAELAERVDAQVRLVYQGDINLERGLGTIVDAMTVVESHYVLFIVGTGPHASALEQRVRAKGLEERVRLLGRVERRHLRDIMDRCDIGVVCYPASGLNNVYCASNKIFEYAQAGLPVVSTCQPPLAGLVGRYGVGVLVGCSGGALDVEEVARAIRQVASGRERMKAGIAEMLSANSWEIESKHLTWRVNRTVRGVSGV